MARQKGSANLAATIEPLAGGALDARTVVPTEADLILASNFPYPYVGMFTVVKATGEMWILTDEDVTDIEHWHKVGSGGSGSLIEGYYNETDGKFYEEDTYTTEIEGADDTLYISLDTNLLYRFDGTDFIVMSSKSTTRTLTQAEFNALPQSEKDNGTIYYITDSSAVQGISVMGNRFDKANIYTADERMVGSYMGKPLYQKTLGITISSEYSVVSGSIMMGSYSLLDANLDIEDMPFADGFYTDGAETLSFLDVWYNKSDSKLYFITYLEREDVVAEITIQYTKIHDGTVAVSNGTDYSTDEQIIGSWIDGKKLYQKTVDCGALPNNTTKNVAHNIENAEKFVYMEGYATSGTGFLFLNHPFGQSSSISYANAAVNGDNINIKTLSNLSAYTESYITLRYTKTTD